ncbi:hypothetical protein BJY24_005557 [Nocardia transvalensis]|uniref:Uncharacterized protein n=1 Tax=Nocardia transvalensis TaxID=37333 RepID=A0A7W9PIR0_9NOCA|nr:hypothetical protein [Nocardia transvalensis]MBB5916645.1 hypothetical protein [Nocardia transvalensis]
MKADLTNDRRGHGTPEHESLLPSILDAFDREITCAVCKYHAPPFLSGDEIPVPVPTDAPMYKFECPHGREIFEGRVETAFVRELSDRERRAWRSAESVDRRVERIGVILMCALVLGSLTLDILILVGRRQGWEPPGLTATVTVAVMTLVIPAYLTTNPDQRRRAGAILAWLWAVVCRLPVPITRSIVWVMNRERFAYPLRWIAVCLFIFGSLLDLLASWFTAGAGAARRVGASSMRSTSAAARDRFGGPSESAHPASPVVRAVAGRGSCCDARSAAGMPVRWSIWRGVSRDRSTRSPAWRRRGRREPRWSGHRCPRS